MPEQPGGVWTARGVQRGAGNTVSRLSAEGNFSPTPAKQHTKLDLSLPSNQQRVFEMLSSLDLPRPERAFTVCHKHLILAQLNSLISDVHYH
jgi:hypothetical protein